MLDIEWWPNINTIKYFKLLYLFIDIRRITKTIYAKDLTCGKYSINERPIVRVNDVKTCVQLMIKMFQSNTSDE